jgi:DNA-binding NtrC family response regulator
MASVLVIDDDRDFCCTLGESLEAAGYDVRTAFDGETGLAEFTRMRADVVLLDVIMPGKMEGVETMSELADVHPETPIVVMSGGGTGDPKNYLCSAEALGASATIAKPFERTALLAILEKVTGEVKAPD